MRLCVRHGLMGEVALTMEGVERATLGWDIMTRMASVLKLVCPFQVVLVCRQFVGHPGTNESPTTRY